MHETFDPTRTDWRAAGERERARDLRRQHDRITARKPIIETAPLRRRCEGPGCNLSKSAFSGTEEFEAHRRLCEGRA